MGQTINICRSELWPSISHHTPLVTELSAIILFHNRVLTAGVEFSFVIRVQHSVTELYPHVTVLCTSYGCIVLVDIAGVACIIREHDKFKNYNI
jgi:hypothetical protein